MKKRTRPPASQIPLLIPLLILALVLLVTGILLAWFTSWRQNKIATLNAGSKIAETARGPVEYLMQGEGPTVLIFHGAPGGYDQAMLLGSDLLKAGFQIVAPSRPGYLRTPLATGLTPAAQADAMAALLDTLGESEPVAVLGSSAGSPAAIQFAVRHPARTRALVLLSPVTKRFTSHAKDPGSEFGRLVLTNLTGDIGSWLAVKMAENDPRKILQWTLDLTGSGDATQQEIVINSVLQPKNVGQLEWFRRFIATFAPLSPRESGTRNDLLQIRSLPDLPLAHVTVPTLIVQGASDQCVPAADSEAAAAKIPKATLLTVANAGHIVQIGPQADAVNSEILHFLKRNLSSF